MMDTVKPETDKACAVCKLTYPLKKLKEIWSSKDNGFVELCDGCLKNFTKDFRKGKFS